MEGCEVFSRIVNALSSLSVGMRRELRARIEEMDDAETTRLMIETFGVGAKACPSCGGVARHRHGSSCGLQRYRCLGCGRTYNALSGSPLARLKHRNLWLKYAFALAMQMTVREAAAYCKVAKNTSLHWRHRFTDALASAQADCLSGIVEVDDIFFRENRKGERRLDRPGFRRGTPAVRAGQKQRLTAVVVARDRSRATIVRRLAAHSKEEIYKILKNAVPNDALLCTDGFGYYETFSRELGITHLRLVARRRERVKHGAFHIQNVNAFASNLKTWMRKFRGVATKHLQKYLNWRCFVDAHPGGGLGEKLLQAILPPCPTAI
jgi:transposase-like protein